MKTVNLQQLIKMIEPGKTHPVLINTLAREDFLKDHIPGSINIPSDQIGQKAPQLFSKSDWVVLYCANSQCDASHKAAEQLEKSGFKNVFRFTGGIEEWKQGNHYCCTETPQSTPDQKKTSQAA